MSLVVARSEDERTIHIDEYDSGRDGMLHCESESDSEEGRTKGASLCARVQRVVQSVADERWHGPLASNVAGVCFEGAFGGDDREEGCEAHRGYQGAEDRTGDRGAAQPDADRGGTNSGGVLREHDMDCGCDGAKAVWKGGGAFLVGRNWGLISVPRVFWSSLSKPTYIDTRWGLYEPVFWEGRRCIARPVEVKEFFESRFGSALTPGVEETSWEYSKEKLDGEDLRMDLRMDLNTRVLYGDSYPYSEELRKAGFIWCPPFWRYLTKAEKSAKWKEECERDAELARQTKEKLELDPVHKEERRVREVEREASA